MEWIEANPLPEVCQNCEELDCTFCDYEGERWTLSRADELRVKRKMLVKAIEYYQRKLKALDEELQALES